MVIRIVLCTVAVLLPFLAVAAAKADEAPVSWVGRVASIEGNLAVKSQAGEWGDSAVINDPIAAGMAVRTSAQGRAVLRIGPETVALGPATELLIGQLDSDGSQFTLQQGRIGLRLAATEPTLNVEIDSARGAVRLLTPGDYDIAAGDDRGNTRVAAIDGRARIVGAALDQVVATGSASVLSAGKPVTAGPEGAVIDEFVSWWRPASTAELEPPTPGYVSAAMTGHEMLDANGSWQTVEDLGAVWFPKDVPADWAPYRYGHWRWIAPWGWTWIDDMSWGFAPSHYGRWARLPGDSGERWGWVPGSLVQNPVYTPAAVAFLGTAGVGISYPDAFGPAVAWFPLAPREIFWPRYTSDLAAIRRLNSGTAGDLNAIAEMGDGGPPAAIVNGKYQHRRFASAVPRAVFLAGKPVQPALVQLPEQRLQDAPLLAGSPQISPPPPASTIASRGSAPGGQTGGQAGGPPGLQTAARAAARHPAVVKPLLVRAQQRARMIIAVAKQRHAQVQRAATPRVVPATLSRNAKARLHIAAFHRRSNR